MSYGDQSGRWNKIASTLSWFAGFAAITGTIAFFLKAYVITVFSAIAVFVLVRARMYAYTMIKRYFDLANIQSLIKAQGLTGPQRARMATRIYRARD